MLNSSDPVKVIWWTKAGHLTCTIAPALYLDFVLTYTGAKHLRIFKRLCYLYAAFTIAGMLSTNYYFPSSVHHYSWGLYAKAGWLACVDAIFGCIVASVAFWLIYQKASSKGNTLSANERNRFRYLTLALGFFSFALLDYVPKFGIPMPPIGSYFILAFAFTVTYAIVKHQILDFSIVIRRTAVYSILAALITATYLMAVVVMEKWFQGYLGYRSVVATAIVGFAVAMGFVPLRNYVQRFVDRYFFHKSHEELVEENEQLRKQVERTERLKAVATLAAGMAHEIKNPLTSIKTFAEFLPEKYDDPAFREKFAKIMGQEVDKMNELIQRLLEFAKPSPPQLELVEVSNTIKETLDFIQGTLVKKQVQVETSFGAPDQVAADKAQLKQVFLNLLLNSVEAMNGPGRIRISTLRENGHLQVSVSDTGPGIAPKDLQHVFDPFYTTKPTGTGLGLSVVHSIIRQHGGRVNIQSKLGQGTTVRIDLPVNGGSHG